MSLLLLLIAIDLVVIALLDLAVPYFSHPLWRMFVTFLLLGFVFLGFKMARMLLGLSLAVGLFFQIGNSVGFVMEGHWGAYVANGAFLGLGLTAFWFLCLSPKTEFFLAAQRQ